MLDLDLPEPAPKQARQVPSSKVVWSRYRPANPLHCDDCLAEVHASWPNNTHAPNRAQFRRRLGAEVTFHCISHAQAQRARDAEAGTRTAR